MANSFDLPAYLSRIGYEGTTQPTLESLSGIVLAHSQQIAFENLNPFLGWPVPLDVQSLQDKLVGSRRGGYCFEHNLLLQQALTAIGLPSVGLAARVLWMGPEDAVTARGHMALQVEVEAETYLADVGFGGQTLTGVLRLVPDEEQPTPHGTFRLTQMPSGDFRQQVLLGGQWRTTYSFDLTPNYLVDYEVTNYFLSTHPESHFRNGLIAARPSPEGRYSLHNRSFSHYDHDGNVESSEITSAAELREVLHDHFGVTAPGELDDAFDRLP